MHRVIKFNLPLNVGTKPDFPLHVNLAKILKKYKPTNLENNLAALSDVRNVYPYDPANLSWEPLPQVDSGGLPKLCLGPRELWETELCISRKRNESVE